MNVFQIWQRVKADNPGMSVCEVGATIGRIWRELDEARKQLFILEFNNDKVGLQVVFDTI